MHAKRIAVCALFLALALTAGLVATRAHAATIADLQALGFTVQQSNPGPAGQNCPTYYVSGWGVGTYFNCQSMDVVDSLANPVTHCDLVWQYQHPEQMDARQQISRRGWMVTSDLCADVFTVKNPTDSTVRYSGPGSSLVVLAAIIGDPPAPPVVVTPPVTQTVTVTVERVVNAPAPPPVTETVTQTVTTTVTTPAPPVVAPKKQPVKKAALKKASVKPLKRRQVRTR